MESGILVCGLRVLLGLDVKKPLCDEKSPDGFEYSDSELETGRIYLREITCSPEDAFRLCAVLTSGLSLELTTKKISETKTTPADSKILQPICNLVSDMPDRKSLTA